MNLVLPEYRGYGRSGGKPSQATILADLVRIHDQMVTRPEVDPSRVLFHGRSIGGGVVCALAAVRKPHAMILMSTFTSIHDVAKKWFVPKSLIADPFESLEVVRTLDIPILVVHGTEDRLIPPSHGHALANGGCSRWHR
jgi:fermentation-respiration switch protein FrsA (DUF1100 family)